MANASMTSGLGEHRHVHLVRLRVQRLLLLRGQRVVGGVVRDHLAGVGLVRRAVPLDALDGEPRARAARG